MVDDVYVPDQYWRERLAVVGGLRSTGHVGYSEAYNHWLYRRKAIVLRRALRHVTSVERAADLGSGVGWAVDQLLRHGARHVHGVDISAAAVDDLRARFPSCTFDEVRLGDDPLPLADAAVDCATFLDVAYHIVDDGAFERSVADATRVLRPGGSLVVIDGFLPTEARPAAHVRFRSAAHWHATARAAGLEVVASIPCYRWLSRPRADSRLRRLPEPLRGAIELGLDAVAPRPSHLSCVVYRRAASPA